MTIFGLKMMLKIGLEFFILKLNEPLQRYLLKVSKNRNDFVKTSFFPKTNEIIVRISAHYIILNHRAEILTIISLVLGRYDVFIKSFRFLLTFNLPGQFSSFYLKIKDSRPLFTIIFKPKMFI